MSYIGILQVDLSFCGLTCRLTECPDPRVGAAVCATDGSIFVSFPSLCHLNNFNCRSGNKGIYKNYNYIIQYYFSVSFYCDILYIITFINTYILCILLLL